jgi:hypothetical protein
MQAAEERAKQQLRALAPKWNASYRGSEGGVSCSGGGVLLSAQLPTEDLAAAFLVISQALAKDKLAAPAGPYADVC